jgi:hypothetical protein
MMKIILIAPKRAAKRGAAGLLNRAITGLVRALARGYIETTAEVVGTMDKVRRDNMVAGFLEECGEYGPDAMISVSDFCASFAVWWGQDKTDDKFSPSNETISRAMAALGDNGIAADGGDLRDSSRRYYGGVHLNNAGLDFWEGAHSEGMAKGKTARISNARSDVNRIIPAAWAARDSAVRLRGAHGESSRDSPGKGDA